MHRLTFVVTVKKTYILALLCSVGRDRFLRLVHVYLWDETILSPVATCSRRYDFVRTQQRFVLRKSGRDAFSVVNSFRRKHLNIFLIPFSTSLRYLFLFLTSLPWNWSFSPLKFRFFYSIYSTWCLQLSLICVHSASRWTNMSLPCLYFAFHWEMERKYFAFFKKWISFSKNVANYFFSRLRNGDFKKKWKYVLRKKSSKPIICKL